MPSLSARPRAHGRQLTNRQLTNRHGTRSMDPMTPKRPAKRGSLIRPAALFYGLMFALGVGLQYVTAGRFLPPPVWPRPALAAEVVVLAVALILQVVLLRWGTRSNRHIRELFNELAGVFRGVPLRTCVLLAVISGIAEETLFRGALQPVLGPAIATLLFAAVHFPATKRLRPWPLYALVMGIALAALAELSGDIVSAVLLHIAINTISLVTLARRSRQQLRPRGLYSGQNDAHW